MNACYDEIQTDMNKLPTNSITDVPGIKVGHAQNNEALTGCTVILCEHGAVGGVDQRGGAPGTREIELLRPMHLVNKVNAVLLSGGSAFGLDAASGVVHFLEEQGLGYETYHARVPIVPAVILYDLNIGDPKIRPDYEMGYQACINASDTQVQQGNYGAGTGATVGKISGIHLAMKSGIGSSSYFLGDNIVVGALFAVNAFGDIVNPNTNQIIAGVRKSSEQLSTNDQSFLDTMKVMAEQAKQGNLQINFGESTVIGVVATNVLLNKEEANIVAMMSHDGLARTIRPVHTMFDGDTIISLSTGSETCDINVIGAYCAKVTEQAILNAVFNATGAGGLPSHKDIFSR